MANMTPDILSNLAIAMGWKPFGDSPGTRMIDTLARARATDMLSGNTGGAWGPQVTGYKDGGGGNMYGDYSRRQLPIYETFIPNIDQSGARRFLQSLGQQKPATTGDPSVVSTQYRLPYDPMDLYMRDVAALGQQPGNPLLSGTPFVF